MFSQWHILVFFTYGLGVESANLSTNWDTRECFKFYCYYWNDKVYYYYGLPTCPEPLVSLEIYSEDIQREVEDFIYWQSKKESDKKIYGHNVVLNITCDGMDDCNWTDSGRSVTYSNWFGAQWTGIVYFEASEFCRRYKWKTLNITHPSSDSFVRICVKESRNNSEAYCPIYGGTVTFVLGSLLVISVGINIYFAKRTERSKTNSRRPYESPNAGHDAQDYHEIELQLESPNVDQAKSSPPKMDYVNISENQES